MKVVHLIKTGVLPPLLSPLLILVLLETVINMSMAHSAMEDKDVEGVVTSTTIMGDAPSHQTIHHNSNIPSNDPLVRFATSQGMWLYNANTNSITPTNLKLQDHFQ